MEVDFTKQINKSIDNCWKISSNMECKKQDNKEQTPMTRIGICHKIRTIYHRIII